jgi:hypothetical protein
MKPSLLVWSLLSLAVIPTLAVDGSSNSLVKRQEEKTQEVIEEASMSTTFNDIEVPPQKELDAETFASTIADGYW